MLSVGLGARDSEEVPLAVVVVVACAEVRARRERRAVVVRSFILVEVRLEDLSENVVWNSKKVPR